MLKPNPAEVRGISGPTGTPLDGVVSVRREEIATDAVYRWGLVYHCSKVIGRETPHPTDPHSFLVEECPDCHRSVPLTQPEYSCGHEFNGRKCSYRSKSKIAVEYHIRDEHTEHCPVCQLLIGSGDGGRGCGCPTNI